MGRIKRTIISIFLFFMRRWDKWSSKRVDYFIGNSTAVVERIKRCYGRDAVVINPPVRCDLFNISDVDGDYYFVVSRLVPYKRYDLAVKACKELGKKLVIIGDGQEKETLEEIASGDPNIIFLGRQSDEVVKKYMQECKALLFPGEEDFGIVPVEAHACGRPVIAFGKGGVLDTVVDGETGILFKEQSVDSLKEAILSFEKMKFDKAKIRKHALEFDEPVFQNKIKSFIEEKIKEK